MIIPYKFRLIILCVIAMVATMAIFTPILRIAKSKNLVDNPDARKLQQSPVPVLGGIAVFFGITVGLCFFKTMTEMTTLFPVLGAMILMMYVGAIDDLLSLKPSARFWIEIIVALLVLYGLRKCISDFQGLWGIGTLPYWAAFPLSVITYLGIVNAINMIDGIDGLASSFCTLILGCFGLLCFMGQEFSFAALSAVIIGALIPFFLHNVFGYTTKMFIGDAGTLMVGTAISSFVFVILDSDFHFSEEFSMDGFSRVAFCLAVMSIPVADTLRVMGYRIAHRRSPFQPDRNHLHHCFVASGFSYIWTTIIEISLNVMVIVCFALSFFAGASNEIQLLVVIVTAGLADILPLVVLNRTRGGDTGFARFISRCAAKSHVERVGVWHRIQKIIDGKD